MAYSAVETLQEVLKDVYKDPIIKIIDNESGPVMAMIDKNSDNIVGENIVFALQHGRHGGIGARGELDDIPQASPRSYATGRATPKMLAGRINFTDKLMRISANNKAAFIDAVDTQMTDILADAKDMMRRNLMGASDGIMGTVDGAVSNAKVVKVAGNIKQFYRGQIVDIFTLSGQSQNKAVDAKMITDVDTVANTISFENNVTVGDKAYITLAGNYGKELIGLAEIMTTDSTIYGVNRAQNKWYNARVYDKTSSGSPTAFSSMYIQEAIDDIDDFTGKAPNFICCNAGVQRAYILEQQTFKRNTEYMEIDGGYKLLSYNGTPITKEKYMPSGTIYLINTDQFALSQLGDWDWMDRDGAILSRVANKAAYEAVLLKYCELICKNPGAQAKIVGIQEA